MGFHVSLGECMPGVLSEAHNYQDTLGFKALGFGCSGLGLPSPRVRKCHSPSNVEYVNADISEFFYGLHYPKP